MRPRSASSIFVDSGAFSLYTQIGEKDPRYYSLKPGTAFRDYCDRYGRFMQKMVGRVLLANVDVIYDPEKTWETQMFFEKEYGVHPVPVVHFRTPMKWVDHYIRRGYDMIGVGGFAWGGSGTIDWLDRFFLHICPEDNDYLPTIKTHGFALTSWDCLVRYPWWSVDSTTWFTTAAFGGIYVPYLSSRGWCYNLPPNITQVSDRSPSKSDLGRHYHSLAKAEKAIVREWLHDIGSSIQQVSGEGNQPGRGNDPSYIARSHANLMYFKNLEEAQPKYPWPLDPETVKRHRVLYETGFGL